MKLLLFDILSNGNGIPLFNNLINALRLPLAPGPITSGIQYKIVC